MILTLPDPALVLLVGPSGAGKSTFAQAHFRPTEIVSTDALRAMLADDPADQSASSVAFQLLAIVTNGRLRRGLTTVIDATNLRAATRHGLQLSAARYGVPCVAIAFDLPAPVYEARNRQREGRVVSDDVVEDQVARMREALGELEAEGYAALHVLREPESLGQMSIERVPAPRLPISPRAESRRRGAKPGRRWR
ncbi:hypothetical protein BH24CHL5_BH24CHL5_10580 [soil metagenome]